jgi:hypothetical protein
MSGSILHQGAGEDQEHFILNSASQLARYRMLLVIVTVTRHTVPIASTAELQSNGSHPSASLHATTAH